MCTSCLRSLESRVEVLCDHYLPKERTQLGDYEDAQRDDARACVLLVHAEIESYLEDLSTALAQCAVQHIESGNHDAMTAAFLYNAGKRGERLLSGSDVDVARGLENLHKKEVSTTNGVKDYHLKKLFGVFHVGDDWLDDDLVAALNTFGAKRGDIAHNKLISGIKQTINPYETREEIDQVLERLREFDSTMQGMAPEIDSYL